MIEKTEILEIEIEKLNVSSNIRSKYSDDNLMELGESMIKNGQLQPIHIYEDNNKYYIIFGHRRYYAAKMVGIKKLLCILKSKPNENERLITQLTENIHRKDISDIEIENIFILLQKKGLGINQISEMINKSKSWIYEIKKSYMNRKKFGELFVKAGIDMKIKDLNMIDENASEEDIKQAINSIIKDASKKRQVLSEFRKNKKKKNVDDIEKKIFESGENIFNCKLLINFDKKTYLLKIIEPLDNEENDNGYYKSLINKAFKGIDFKNFRHEYD